MEAMPIAHHVLSMYVSYDTAWRMLCDKIEKPTRYDEEILSHTRLSDQLRMIRLGPCTLVEKVVSNKDAGVIRYLLQDHPLYVGERLEQIIDLGSDMPLQYTGAIDWTYRGPATDPLDGGWLRRSMARFKTMAEQVELKLNPQKTR